jgi:hypothetical protein
MYKLKEHRNKTGLRVLYYVVLDENDRIIIITKSGIIARAFLKKQK